jgi:hypothetical protein
MRRIDGPQRVVAHRHRLEVLPFACGSPKLPAIIRQWALPPISAFLDEIHERRLTKDTCR